jgi:hypothetical protein
MPTASNMLGKSPFNGVPPEVCNLVWEFLPPSVIATVARVNKTWYCVSRSFLAEILGDTIANGTEMNQTQNIHYLTRTKKVQIQTTFSLQTLLVQNREADVTPTQGDLEEFDFVFFVFEAKGIF